MCHKLPERSFFYKGRQFPICARCTGILAGYILALICIFFTNIPLIFCLLLLIPLGIDGVGQYLGIWTSNNIRRLITGMLAGISVIYIISFIAKLGFHQGYSLIKLLKNS